MAHAERRHGTSGIRQGLTQPKIWGQLVQQLLRSPAATFEVASGHGCHQCEYQEDASRCCRGMHPPCRLNEVSFTRCHTSPEVPRLFVAGRYCVYALDAVTLLRKHDDRARRAEDGRPDWRTAPSADTWSRRTTMRRGMVRAGPAEWRIRSHADAHLVTPRERFPAERLVESETLRGLSLSGGDR